MSRLRRLADVLEETPHTVIVDWDEPVPDWSWDDLDRLTCFTMLSRYRPSAMPSGNWCGDLAMWVCKVYGADSEIYFGEEANVGLMATVMLGLTPLEGAALFEFQMSPTAGDDVDRIAFCGILTPDRAAKALGGSRTGCFRLSCGTNWIIKRTCMTWGIGLKTPLGRTYRTMMTCRPTQRESRKHKNCAAAIGQPVV